MVTLKAIARDSRSPFSPLVGGIVTLEDITLSFNLSPICRSMHPVIFSFSLAPPYMIDSKVTDDHLNANTG